MKNDKPPRISQAPEPITPVRSRGEHSSPALAPARWALWKLMPSVELWQAVCLSLNIEPEERLTSRGLTSRGPSKHVALPTDFWDRLMVCQARVSSTNGPIHPQGALYRGMLTDPTCPVLQAEVAAFLVSVGLPVPEEMRPGGHDVEVRVPDPHVRTPLAAPASNAVIATPETPKQRRARLLAMFDAELLEGGERGALTRVFKREKRTRPTADRSNVGKEVTKAREERDAERRGGGLTHLLR